MTYKKLNVEPIAIEYRPKVNVGDTLHDDDFEPMFWWDDSPYWLDEFIRTHNNPWVSDNFPEYIHGYEADNYYNPIFIELSDDGETVNIYMEVA